MNPSKTLILFVFGMNTIIYLLSASSMLSVGTGYGGFLIMTLGAAYVVLMTVISSLIMFLIIFLLKKLWFEKKQGVDKETGEWSTATVLIIILALIMYKPQEKIEMANNKYKEILTSKLAENRSEMMIIQSLATDSLENWTRNQLSRYQYLNSSDWMVDSVICLNKTKDKAVITILTQNHFPESQDDAIILLYGVKISEQWYFFKGSFISLNRQGNHNPIDEPLGFSKLHELAVEKVFWNYLKQDSKTKEWKINEKFFDVFISNGYHGSSRPQTQAAWDSVYLKLSNPW